MTINSWDGFFSAVQNMRSLQKAYFSSRSPSALIDAKAAEKAVDDFVKERNQRMDDKEQGDLFNK
ncbi:hypothetical protein FACS1894124_5010 [Spirochaetia bacterium]|nr:hypothetical protein FACS1894124_5010 [Spirochaetia bacterium]